MLITANKTAARWIMALVATLVVSASPAMSAPSGRLDVNSASVEELTALPGIGAAKAAAIIDERSRMPFTSVEDLERVKGIGPSLIADLREHVSVSKRKSD